MDKDEYLKQFAASLRAAADLVERDMLERVEAQIDYEHVTEPDYRNFTMRTRLTGRQTVTIRLTGNPQDIREAGWGDDRNALPLTRPALGVSVDVRNADNTSDAPP